MNRYQPSAPRPVAEFTETLVGAVVLPDPSQPSPVIPVGDRAQCGLIADHLIVGTENGRGCEMTLGDLVIALDVDEPSIDGGLLGTIRAGRVCVEGLVNGEVESGTFELFGSEPGDGLRMRYAIIAIDDDHKRWLVRGTKLVVDEVSGNVIRRLWSETTTLFVTVSQLPVGMGARYATIDDAKLAPESVAALGIVHVRASHFVRQLASLNGQAGPGGGLEALLRLGRFFARKSWDQYVVRKAGSHTDREPTSAAGTNGIEAAFSQH